MQLHDRLDTIARLTPAQKQGLHKLKLITVRDLLFHFPSRYGAPGIQKKIASVLAEEQVVLYGTIEKLKTSKAFRKKIAMAEARLTDDTGNIKLIWFHQPYIAKKFKENMLVRVEGKVFERNGSYYLSNPKIEQINEMPPEANSLFGSSETHQPLTPVYPESRGVSTHWIQHKIQTVLKSGILEKIKDPLPSAILTTYHLPTLHTALIWIHAPKKERDALAARKRFSFEEIFLIQLKRHLEKSARSKSPAYPIKKKMQDIQSFIDRFPFTATKAQEKAIRDILKDFARETPMARLLEGDVGSGKTSVAAATVYASATTRPKESGSGALQTAYMVPTEVLAKQQFENFIKFFAHMPITIGLLTGSGCKKFPSKVDPTAATEISRAQLLKWVANGEIPIIVGTHALIQKTVRFKNLALVIVDEQHRFGVAQRQTLLQKEGVTPHLLSMTATPIPRTLALTMYGDLDLTILDEMPKGRKPVMTEIIPPDKRDAVYEKIRDELLQGRQAYVICPRIDEPDPDKVLALNAKSAKAEAKRLQQKIFPEYTVGVLHGKQTPKEKEAVMLRFSRGEINILVATSVVEVGVSVPNATMIIIEGAERFGLAQLHQLRGRVIRSTHQAYCFVFTESRAPKTIERLRALTIAKNGFELAEQDLVFRGAGTLSGIRQWGMSDVAMDALQNLKMVEAAREEARLLLERDPLLSKYPLLKESVASASHIHFE